MDEVRIRKARPKDAEICGRICYEAFLKINADHGFPPEMPGPETGIGILTTMFSHPGFYCVVAEAGGKLVGSNCLDERSPVLGVGPITIDPAQQNQGIGRQLMQAVLDRASARKAPAVRLLQSGFHCRSLSLYTKLGFDTREPIALMRREEPQGKMTRGPSPRQKPVREKFDGYRVRKATPADLDAANRICTQVHGHHRGGELADAIEKGTARVVLRHGRITGYASVLATFGHAVAESNLDLQALIADAKQFGGAGILVPIRNAALFRWCLAQGLRMIQPMTLMSIGLYNEPAGAYLPSVLY
jgi:GNAT superfamily N-acetyltransferase